MLGDSLGDSEGLSEGDCDGLSAGSVPIASQIICLPLLST